jgi:flagellar basal-body rod modification protein FlgD
VTNPITNRTTTAAAAANASATTGDLTSRLGKQDFLTLLVAQMKNQDPLKPNDDQQFIAQLAQFSTLETMQNLDQRLEAISGAQMLGEAAGLIGKSVEAALADGSRVSGTVSEVRLVDGSPWLTVGDQTVELSRIVGVGDRQTTQPTGTTPATSLPTAQTPPATTTPQSSQSK